MTRAALMLGCSALLLTSAAPPPLFAGPIGVQDRSSPVRCVRERPDRDGRRPVPVGMPAPVYAPMPAPPAPTAPPPPVVAPAYAPQVVVTGSTAQPGPARLRMRPQIWGYGSTP